MTNKLRNSDWKNPQLLVGLLMKEMALLCTVLVRPGIETALLAPAVETPINEALDDAIQE